MRRVEQLKGFTTMAADRLVYITLAIHFLGRLFSFEVTSSEDQFRNSLAHGHAPPP